jgi:beta-glucanase (GH16 family)
LTTLPDDIYQETQGNFQTFGFEYYGNKDKRSDGYITWLANGKKSLSMTAAAVGPDSMAEIQSRPVPEEPMSIVMNLAISESFQKVDVANLRFPGYFKVDYVRVYQRKGETNIGCDPKDYPTTQYIRDHLDVYTSKLGL